MKKKLRKKGFVSIEAVISMSAVLMIVLMAIGFIVYMYPKIMLEKEVHLLAQKAKIQGGLTDNISQPVNSDIETFLKSLEGKGYKKDTIEITARTIPGDLNCIGVTPLNTNGNNYVKRDSKMTIQITVKVPANKSGLKGPFAYLHFEDESGQYYYIRETVMSERW